MIMVCAESALLTTLNDAHYSNDFSGKSRSSTITLAFLIQKTNLTLEEAIVQVFTIDLNSNFCIVFNVLGPAI